MLINFCNLVAALKAVLGGQSRFKPVAVLGTCVGVALRAPRILILQTYRRTARS